MNSTIASLAILKVNWDYLKKDYIESFVPFVATLIKTRKYPTVEVNTLCEDFSRDYGLIIPFHPMMSILKRAKKKGASKKESRRQVSTCRNKGF
jgi:hypothetical protein